MRIRKSIRPLIDWLDYNGYTVVTKATKATKEFIDASGRHKVKGNMDIELAVNAMDMAPHLDLMVLFSGDGDFRSLVQVVDRDVGRGDQNRLRVGERVEAIFAIAVTHPSRAGAAERRGLDEQVNIHQVHPAPAVG